ncbi:type VI secretion system-associated protein TagF [Accumulibacter sp.]|uniref:type VI secretion system-associated protein TagF n=1 Tax=Accumulibacter sp. TaxID=2053492 RepID=UPI0025CF1278|nr:type VI secretion system-associated protein TagF [Accumulibacter sp.]MCM8614276.1 type VI secretion system-associated protein TagF [Accumulibacter sp.]MCM8638072.1 type VI secretion system-associated protein TagF [Accumulibacter sp.]MCM8641443.1 type VI secretion system-associated protein TagF [Accumulibacter sp.]
MTAAAGWYGKLPQLGDFSQRRLPQNFVDHWDAWLQEGITHSRSELGDDWLESFLTANVWHFFLSPGVLGTQAWAGIWMPSVDRVGRYFPLTVAAELPPETMLLTAAPALDAWLRRVEDCARGMLELDHGAGDLDDSLRELGLPTLNGQAAPHCAAAAEQLARQEPVIDLQSMCGKSFPAKCLAAIASVRLQAAFAGYSLWWCHGCDGTSGGFAHRGLPMASFLTKMLVYSPASETTPAIGGI